MTGTVFGGRSEFQEILIGKLDMSCHWVKEATGDVTTQETESHYVAST